METGCKGCKAARQIFHTMKEKYQEFSEKIEDGGETLSEKIEKIYKIVEEYKKDKRNG
jgi:hypothetical protein